MRLSPVVVNEKGHGKAYPKFSLSRVVLTFYPLQEGGVAMRGAWESFFHDLSVENPSLWTRAGPRNEVEMGNRLQALKWWLVRRWSRADKTVNATVYGENAEDEFGNWSKFKRFLIRKWTKELSAKRPTTDEEEAILGDTGGGDGGILADGLLGATEMLTVSGAPTTTIAIDEDDHIHEQATQGNLRFARPRARMERTRRPDALTSLGVDARGSRSSSDGRNSGVLVEEEDPRWIHQLGLQGKGWWFRRSSNSPGRRARAPSSSGEAVSVNAARRSSDSSGKRARSPLGQDQGQLAVDHVMEGQDENERPSSE